MARYEFKLPDIGEGIAEAEIVAWHVKLGDRVEEDQQLADMMTDKATVEIPSPYAGPVSRIHVKAGEVVRVGTVLVTIGTGDVPPAGTEDGRSAKPTEKISPDAPQEAVKATPPVRRLARSLGVDLGTVTATGPGGRVRREDVEAAAAAQPTAPPESTPAPSERREPLRGIRRTIAERMSVAHREIPSVTHVEECDVTELDATRRLASERNPDGPKLTYLPFIVKAVVAALGDYPALNASLDEGAGEIIFHDHYNIGIAVDTPSGLVVPVVKDADRKGIVELSREFATISAKARDGKLSPGDMQGGTFTISSLGGIGGTGFTPIVNAPEVAILGVVRSATRPVWNGTEFTPRLMLPVALSYDHRVIDGALAARFTRQLCHVLEDVRRLVL